VKVHLHRIYRKLGIANRTALAVLAPTIALISR
jgi:DNA-binding NarL/FixJ family response regulator